MKNLGFHQEMCWQLRFCNKIVLWSPEHPRTQPPSHAHTQHTRTPTHTKQNTDRQTEAHMDTQTHTQLGQEAGIGNTHKQSYRATATEPPNHMPDARCQMNRLTDTSQTDSHTGTQTQKHTHTHTHTQPQSHPARQTYTGTHRHTTQNPEPDADRATRIYQSHRWTTQKKITQPEGTNVKHRKQIGCTHSSQEQSCTRKARTLTVTVDCR